MGVWDREPSEEIRELSIENMKRLGMVLADMCYIALNAFTEKKGRPLTQAEKTLVMETELYLVIEQNIEDDSWREMIFQMALDKYQKQVNNT